MTNETSPLTDTDILAAIIHRALDLRSYCDDNDAIAAELRDTTDDIITTPFLSDDARIDAMTDRFTRSDAFDALMRFPLRASTIDDI